MKWKDAVERSQHGLAVTLVEKGHALRLVNAAGEMFKIESPEGKPQDSSNSRRRIGLMDWQPVTAPLARFKHFTELMEMAGVPPTLCDLHAGPRGLQAMMRELANRHTELVNTVQGILKVDYLDEGLADKLDEIIYNATKMRELL